MLRKPKTRHKLYKLQTIIWHLIYKHLVASTEGRGAIVIFVISIANALKKDVHLAGVKSFHLFAMCVRRRGMATLPIGFGNGDEAKLLDHRVRNKLQSHLGLCRPIAQGSNMEDKQTKMGGGRGRAQESSEKCEV